jgi:hypothetical protein
MRQMKKTTFFARALFCQHYFIHSYIFDRDRLIVLTATHILLSQAKSTRESGDAAAGKPCTYACIGRTEWTEKSKNIFRKIPFHDIM